jgi:hypothetical protein
MRGAWAIATFFACMGLAAAATSASTWADYCRAQFPDAVRQLQCVRHAMDPAQPEPPAPTNQPAPISENAAAPSALVAPMTQLQVIFGFYDRRFPGFNGGQEHLGVDFTAGPGTPVYALCDGVVVSNRTDRAEIVAAVLVVEHDCAQPVGKVYAYYGHIQSNLAQGEAMPAGGTLGTVRPWPGNGHLHLGLATQYLEENWGTYPRGVTLPALEDQGWLNPLNYLSVAPPPVLPQRRASPVPPRNVTPRTMPKRGVPAPRAAAQRQHHAASKRVLAQAPVHRQHGAGNVARKR